MTAIYFACTTFCCSISGICLTLYKIQEICRSEVCGHDQRSETWTSKRPIHLISLRCLIVLWSSLFIPRKRDYISLSPWGLQAVAYRELSSATGIPWGVWDTCMGQEGGHRSWRWPVLLWLPGVPQGTTQHMSHLCVGSWMISLTCRSLYQGWWIFPQIS